MNMRHFSCVLLCSAFLLPGTLWARTALTPAPKRDDANLQLGEAGNLVNELRTVGLTKGTNVVLFSWKGVSVDPRSLALNVLGTDDVRVIGLTFPPGGSGAVEAEVFSEQDTVATFRVSYLVGGITRDISYQAVLDVSGEQWRIHKEATAFNRSGERFEQVDVSLGSGLNYTGPLLHPEGRKVAAQTPSPMAVKRIYRVMLNPMPYVAGAPQPLNPELYYLLDNDVALTPDRSVLLPGKMRLFQQDKQGSQAFLGEDVLATLATGERGEVRGGGAQDVRVTWFLELDEDRNVVRSRRSTQEPVDDQVVRADRYQRFRVVIKNFKAGRAMVWATIPSAYSSGVKVFKSTHDADVEHAHTDGVTVKVDAPGGGAETVARVELLYTDYVFHTY